MSIRGRRNGGGKGGRRGVGGVIGKRENGRGMGGGIGIGIGIGMGIGSGIVGGIGIGGGTERESLIVVHERQPSELAFPFPIENGVLESNIIDRPSSLQKNTNTNTRPTTSETKSFRKRVSNAAH